MVEMDDHDDPLFGLISSFEEGMAPLRAEIHKLRKKNERLEDDVVFARKDAKSLRAKIQEDEVKRKSERQRLVEWLDRRLAQQEDAMAHGYISQETKRVMKIEVSVLKRYRDIILESGHTKGIDNPALSRAKLL
jgi:hypothetical protein